MMIHRKLRITAFWGALAIAYVCAIWPESSAPSLTPSDKVDHGITFITLSVLIRLAYPRRPLWLAAAALLAFGIFIEISQALPFIARDASSADVIADAIAILIGLTATVAAKRLAPKLFAD